MMSEEELLSTINEVSKLPELESISPLNEEIGMDKENIVTNEKKTHNDTDTNNDDNDGNKENWCFKNESTQNAWKKRMKKFKPKKKKKLNATQRLLKAKKMNTSYIHTNTKKNSKDNKKPIFKDKAKIMKIGPGL